MVLFVTGATGLLGGELLVTLAQRPQVRRLYCLVRAASPAEGQRRLRGVFDLHGDPFDPARVIPVVGDLADAALPARLARTEGLAAVTHIVHAAANTSFARLSDDLVEKVNVRGLELVLAWARTLTRLELFVYVGTASARGRTAGSRVIHEDESPDPAARHLVKYTHTKMLGELAVARALSAAQTLIVRPSIILGDSRGLVPRSNVMLWTVAALNRLRLIPVKPDARLDIISVDYAARALGELIFGSRTHRVYHVSSGPAGVTTPRQLGEAIAPYYPPDPPLAYVRIGLLPQMRNWARGRLAKGSELHAYQQYLDYWTAIFANDRARLRVLLAGLEPYLHFMEMGQVFDNSRLLAETVVGQSVPAHAYLAKCVPYLKVIDVFQGALDP